MLALRRLNSTDYERAEKLIPVNRSKLVSGGKVAPRWIDKGARFWYRGEGPQGHWFVLVEPAKRLRKPAFDHQRLATALAAASGSPVDAAALPFAAIEFSDGAVEFDALGAHWRCSLESYACAKVENHTPPNPLEVKSPDGKWAVSRRGHDLWIRSLVSGDERPLTSDGVADGSYGARRTA